MKSSTLRFSVVVPCFNEASYIEKTLKSLKNQDFEGEYEIIIVDNNCTDKTVEIVNKYNVNVVSEKNPGVCFARQAGMEAAKGEIVISTDADTIHSKNWLSIIDKSFNNYSDAVAVCGPCKYFDGPWWGRVYPYLLFFPDYIYSKLIKRPFYITATNTAYNKSKFKGYDTSMTQGGDEMYVLHSIKKKGRVVFNYSNPVFTSARRLKGGLIYNLFVSFIFYYLIAYNVNKLFKRRIIGTAPAFRENMASKTYRKIKETLISQ